MKFLIPSNHSRARNVLLSIFVFAASAVIADEIDVESWYPRTVTGEKGTIIMYAPQIDSWKNFKLSARGWRFG